MTVNVSKNFAANEENNATFEPGTDKKEMRVLTKDELLEGYTGILEKKVLSPASSAAAFKADSLTSLD